MPRPRRRRPGSSALLAAALPALLSACQASSERLTAEEAVLRRRVEGLRSLVGSAERGRFVPFDQVLVVVDESLVQELVTAATPFEHLIAGKYRIRVNGAHVSFDDGFALVRLDGTASFVGAGEEPASAQLGVFGAIDVVDLDPSSGTLRGEVRVVAVEARRVDVLGVKAPAEKLVEDLSLERLEAFQEILEAIEIPVRLEREVELPGVGPAGGLEIASAAVPLSASVQDVKAFRGRLWVSVAVGVEPRP